MTLHDESDGPCTTTAVELRFGPFRLLGPHGPLLTGNRVVVLPRKPLALLWMLTKRAGEVVTKNEVLAEIWPRLVVTEGAISASLRDLRRALGDDARQPRFIATAHRIGYRFIAEVRVHAPMPEAKATPAPVLRVSPGAPAPPVGRARESALLEAAFARSLAGQRQVVFVTGEAGIGKSLLIDDFVARLEMHAASPDADAASADRLLIGHGQCIEHYGSGEPFLPILEAVTRLCRQSPEAPLLPLLRQHAPTWIAQLPGLFHADMSAAPSPSAANGSVERMLREMADAIDMIAADRPLVLILEDMHWSDRSTVDWLAMLARRRERARLLVIATCRPVELIVSAHPLKQVKQDLVTRGAASEIALGRLLASDVRDYVEQRMRHRDAASDLAAAVFRRSQGHPLFMVHMADDLLCMPDGGAVFDETTLPLGVSDLIEAQLARLAPEQLAVLEAASVAGAEFAVAAVAAALQRPVDDVERLLETLALQGQFVEARGLAVWHDHTFSGLYGFCHDLVRDGLYRRLGSARRARMHGAIGARLAVAHGMRTSDIAAELALHFENAHDPWRAVRHLREAGHKALQRCAHVEALGHASKGLALLASTTTSTAEQESAELQLRLIEGAALLATRGYAAPEVEATYTRAMALSLALNDRAAIGPALSGLYNLYLTRAAFPQVRAIAEQVLAQLQRRPDPVHAMLAHNVRGTALLFSGDPVASLEHVDATLALYDVDTHQHLAIDYGEDPAIASHHYAALSRWLLGDAQAAQQHLRAGFSLAQRLGHPFGEAQMLWTEAVIALDVRELDRVERATGRLIALCADYGFPLWRAGGQILRGGALAGQGRYDEGRALTDAGLSAWQEAGTLLTLPHALAVAARVDADHGQIADALHKIEQALAAAARTGERWYEPELHRLQGAFMQQRPSAGAVELKRAKASFERAVALARAQRSRLLQERATASLAQFSRQTSAEITPRS